MSLSTCLHCGGHVPLGPEASNVCENCGKGIFSSPVQFVQPHPDAPVKSGLFGYKGDAHSKEDAMRRKD